MMDDIQNIYITVKLESILKPKLKTLNKKHKQIVKTKQKQ